MAAADFLINGSPPGAIGFDAQPGDVLELKLASAPALDSARVLYSVVIASLDAPELVFDPPTGRPSTPTGTVKITLPPKGVHSYELQCEVNEGRNARGLLDPGFTRQRIVAIRSALAGLRKLLPAESTQYDARGWSDEQNREVDQVEEALGSIGGNVLAGAGLTKQGSTFEIVAVDASIAVSPDAIGVGVLQTDAQHGLRAGGLLHALADAANAGFLSPAQFALLAAATQAPVADTLVRRGANAEAMLGRLMLGAGGPDLFPSFGATVVRSPGGLLTTVAPAGPVFGTAKAFDVVTGNVKTSAAAPATLLTYPLPPACAALLRAEVLAYAPSSGNVGVYERKLGIKRAGVGPATPVGIVQPIGADGEDIAAWDATIDWSGTDARVRVTGSPNVDVQWFARLFVTLFAP